MRKITKVPDNIKDSLIEDTINSHEKLPDDIFEYIHYSEYVDLLYSFLLDKRDPAVKDLVLKLKRRKILCGNVLEGLSECGLSDILKQLKKENRISFKEFVDEFLERINQIAKNKARKYTLIYPLNFKLKNAINEKTQNKAFTVGRDTFEILSHKEFITEFSDLITKNIVDLGKELMELKGDSVVDDFKILDVKANLKQLNEVTSGADPYGKRSFFIMEDYAKDLAFVLDHVAKRLQCILGLLTFAQYRQTGSLFMGISGPISHLQLSHILVFEEEKYIKGLYFTKQDLTNENIDEATISNFILALDLYGKIKSRKIRDILYNALKAYYAASTDGDPVYSFLKYWICIEICLVKSESITEYEMIERLKSIVSSGHVKYLDYRIDSLYEKRNDLIHELKMNISQSDRNLAKLLCDELVTFMLENGNSFSSLQDFVNRLTSIRNGNKSIKKIGRPVNEKLVFRLGGDET